MEPQEKHTMVIESTHPSGAEEWFCPTCGRRILMQWPPNYRKIVLEEGDSNVVHSGGKGGMQIGSAQIDQGVQTTEQPEDDQPIEIDPESLKPWKNFLQNLDVDDRLDHNASR